MKENTHHLNFIARQDDWTKKGFELIKKGGLFSLLLFFLPTVSKMVGLGTFKKTNKQKTQQKQQTQSKYLADAVMCPSLQGSAHWERMWKERAAGK